jgi:hypothetical protein
VPPFYAGVIHGGLGETEEALAALEKAFEERSGWMAFLKVEPFFEGLHGRPRFDRLLQKVGLIEVSRG